MKQMMKSKLVSKSSEETFAFGKELAQSLSEGMVVCFEGELGAGKTTLIKGISEGLGIDSSLVTSPTFVYLNLYGNLAHFDLYRIETLEKFQGMGFEEYLQGTFITFVEWPEIIEPILNSDALHVQLLHEGEDNRMIEVS